MTEPTMKPSSHRHTGRVSTPSAWCRGCLSSEESGDLKADKRGVIARKIRRLSARVFESMRQDSLHQAADREVVGCNASVTRCASSTQKRKDQKVGLSRPFSDAHSKVRGLDRVTSRAIEAEDFDHQVDERFIPYALECLISGGAEMLSGLDPDRAKWYRSFANLALLPIRTIYKPKERATVQSIQVSSEDLNGSKWDHLTCEPSFVSKPIKIVQPKKAGFKTTLSHVIHRRTSKLEEKKMRFVHL